MIKKNYRELRKWINSNNLEKRIDYLARKYKGKKIIIYGTGIVFSIISYYYDLSKLNIIGVSDRSFSQNKNDYNYNSYYDPEAYNGYKTISPDEIKDYKPDVILLGTYLFCSTRDALKTQYKSILDNVEIEPLIKRNFLERIFEEPEYNY